MKRPLVWLVLAALVSVLGAGCGEQGDKAIAYGDGLGLDWTPPAGAQQMRISVENYFTRDVVIQIDAPHAHYELTVGPIRQRYMIVPQADYKITGSTYGNSTGMVVLYADPDDHNGAKGLRVRIRP